MEEALPFAGGGQAFAARVACASSQIHKGSAYDKRIKSPVSDELLPCSFFFPRLQC